MDNPFEVDADVASGLREGETFTHTDGHRYRVEKRTARAFAVTRYYWWDMLYDRYLRKDANA